MNSSRSFDRAASYYDQTRPLPGPIAEAGMQAILEITGPSPGPRDRSRHRTN